MKQLIKLLIALSVAATLLSACGGKTKIESNLGIKGAPDWVNEGTSAVSDKKGRLIQGVGMSAPIGDVSLQKNTADNRARAEVARIMSTYIDTTMKDYTESVNGQVDANVSREINSVSRLALNGAEIIGRWKDKKTGDIYSFAEMDMKKLDKMMAESEKLGASFKQYYETNSQTGFEKLAGEE